MMTEKLKRVVLKEEMVAITGKATKGILLNQLIYWTEILNKADQEIQKEIDEYKKMGLDDQAEKKKNTLRNGWFWKSGEELAEECMGIISSKTINRLMNELAESNFILKGKNPDPKKKWDRTNWYKVNLDHVRNELKKLGYVLEGYAMPEDKKEPESPSSRISQNETCISQNEISISQNETCISHSETTIPEITSEITSEISTNTTVKESINLEKSKKLEDEIYDLEVGLMTKKVLNRMIDRLILFNIDLLDIELLFKNNNLKDDIFSEVLRDVLKSEIKKSFKGKMQASINNRITYTEKKAAAIKKPIRQEIVPDWWKEEQAAASDNIEQPEEDWQLEAKKLQDELRSNYKQA